MEQSDLIIRRVNKKRFPRLLHITLVFLFSILQSWFKIRFLEKPRDGKRKTVYARFFEPTVQCTVLYDWTSIFGLSWDRTGTFGPSPAARPEPDWY